MRQDTKLRLDDRVIQALRNHAADQGVSFNSLTESILFTYAKSIGRLPMDAQPLPENRGGKRVGSGRPPNA